MEIPRKKTSAANVFHRTDAGDCWDSRIKKERPDPFRTGAAPGQVLNGETWHNLHLIIFTRAAARQSGKPLPDRERRHCMRQLPQHLIRH